MGSFINRQSSKINHVFYHFLTGRFRFSRKTTDTQKANLNASGESDPFINCKVILASGAEWAYDNQGRFYLLKTNGTENEAAIRELFEYFGLPFWFSEQESLEQSARICQLRTLIEIGYGLPMEYFKRATNTKNSERKIEAELLSIDKGRHAKGAK